MTPAGDFWKDAPMMKPLAILSAIWLFATATSFAQTDGIFAEVQTTAGNFTLQLDYVNAPRAVAHFIRLAEGSRPWVDTRNGGIQSSPYYDGTTFSGVLFSSSTRYALIGGAQYAQENEFLPAWSGGPGYTILDERANGLVLSNGVIAFHTPHPHAIGSEFFITLADLQGYNGVYTVFGRIVSGRDVLERMAAAPIDEAGALLSPATITALTIRRVGASAEAFDVNRTDLPTPSPGFIGIQFTNDTENVVSIRYSAKSECRMVHSPDLLQADWRADHIGFNITDTDRVVHQAFSSTNTGWESQHFLHATQVYYPICSAIPESEGIEFAVEWYEGDLWQFRFDMTTGNGIFQHLPVGASVVSGSAILQACYPYTPNTTYFRIKVGYPVAEGISINEFDYYLGFESSGDTHGIFYVEFPSGWNDGSCVYAFVDPTAATASAKSILPRHETPASSPKANTLRPRAAFTPATN